MNFTNATLSIKGQINSKRFNRDMVLACKTGIGTAKLADIAQRIADGYTITEEVWEKAREEKRKARSANFRIRYARVHVTNVIRATGNAVGATLSATKHALETDHDLLVERRFKLDAHDLVDVGTAKWIAAHRKAGVKVTLDRGQWYKHKRINMDFEELVANLHEQASYYYKKMEGK